MLRSRAVTYGRPLSSCRMVMILGVGDSFLATSLFTLKSLWWVFWYCVIGRANWPCYIGEKVSYVILVDCVSHIYVNPAEHHHDCLMYPLEYCTHLWVFDTGWLMLETFWITEGLEVKFEFASIAVDDVLTTWVSTKPGPVDKVTYCCWWFVKVGLFWFDMCTSVWLPLCTCRNSKLR
jgi:hypothetical protein